MIKKLLTMSISIVLGCLITTTSFAWQPPTEDCKYARADFRDVLKAVQFCKKYRMPSEGRKVLRVSKRACLKVVRQICRSDDGTYNAADRELVAVCDRANIRTDDETGDFTDGEVEVYDEDGNLIVVVVEIKRDDDGNVAAIYVSYKDDELIWSWPPKNDDDDDDDDD